MMDLIRRRPATVGLSVFNDFDKLFNDLWRSFNVPSTELSLPSADIYSENDRHMVVELQVPGLEHKDININVRDDNVLEITGQRTEREEHKDKKRSYMVRESSTSFARQVVLPRGADTENISAELDKGVLKVTIPVEQPQPKRIEIAAPIKGKGAKKLTANAPQKEETK